MYRSMRTVVARREYETPRAANLSSARARRVANPSIISSIVGDDGQNLLFPVHGVFLPHLAAFPPPPPQEVGGTTLSIVLAHATPYFG